jgi:hypothetical protein
MIIIDRIENDRAIVEIGGEMIEIPCSELPNGSKEGDVLVLSVNTEAVGNLKKDNEDRLKRLRERDPGDMEIDL